MIKHGHSVSSLTYITWEAMIQRCGNPKTINFHDYGGRGITICNEWKDYQCFLKDMGIKPKGMSLERIDNNKGYYKENCKWATSKEQARNRTNNVFITFRDKTKCISEWAEDLNFNTSTLYTRLHKRNWSIERALTTPTRKYINNQIRSNLCVLK